MWLTLCRRVSAFACCHNCPDFVTSISSALGEKPADGKSILTGRRGLRLGR